jgi:hypothetical protein
VVQFLFHSTWKLPKQFLFQFICLIAQIKVFFLKMRPSSCQTKSLLNCWNNSTRTSDRVLLWPRPRVTPVSKPPHPFSIVLYSHLNYFKKCKLTNYFQYTIKYKFTWFRFYFHQLLFTFFLQLLQQTKESEAKVIEKKNLQLLFQIIMATHFLQPPHHPLHPKIKKKTIFKSFP